jgi:5-hydroxyisourate hydrolase
VSTLSTHVLDTARGRPAAGVPVRLELAGPAGPTELGRATTDADGRVASLGPGRLEPGTYRLVFDTARYAAAQPGEPGPGFFPEVAVTFTVDGSAPHLHVPLLLSPFGYTTYRGS